MTELHRIIGVPGGGKTTHLARQTRVASQKYDPSRVLVASLTRAAAAEVAGRDTPLPKENIGTLHAHAFRMLDRPALAETAKHMKTWNQQVGAGMKIAESPGDLDGDGLLGQGLRFSEGGDLLRTYQALRNKLVDPAAWPGRVTTFASHWEAFKEQNDLMDFTDLIEQAIERKDRFACDPYVVMVDEAQDTSSLEWQMIQQLSQRAEHLVVVGDPLQALYTWRGASPQAVFGTDPDAVQVLSQSYRVPRAVRDLAMDWIRRMPGAMAVEYHARRDADGNEVAGEVLRRPYTHADAGALLDAVRGDLLAGRTVMVLATCGYMLTPFLARCRDHGEPYHNPYRAKASTWNPLSTRVADALRAFLRPDHECWGEQARGWTWGDARTFTDVLIAKETLAHGAKTFLRAKTTEKTSFGDAGSQPANLDTLMGLLASDACRDAVFDLDTRWWTQNLMHKDAPRGRHINRIANVKGRRALNTPPRLIVGTVHSVKGGEADVVYLMPDLSPTAYWQAYKRPPETEEHQSILRTMFVGMTRAREKLVLCKATGPEAVRW